MSLRTIITGSDPEDEELSASVGLPPYRRWYCFGRRSPGILVARLRSRHQPIARLRWTWQRATRGYDDPSLWSLNHALATLTVVGVKAMRKWAHGYPGEFSEEYAGEGAGGWEKWDDILRQIEEGFQTWLDEDGHFYDKPEQEEKFKNGMALYSHWFSALWD